MNYIKTALEEAEIGVSNNDGGPFGAVIVDKNGNIISKGHNKVLKTNDPTAHAEVVAIRKACKKLETSNLEDYIIYSTCEPCPMCLSAIIWSNIKTVYFSSTRYEAAKIGFRDEQIYDFLNNKNQIINLKRIEDIDCQKFMANYKGEMY